MPFQLPASAAHPNRSAAQSVSNRLFHRCAMQILPRSHSRRSSRSRTEATLAQMVLKTLNRFQAIRTARAAYRFRSVGRGRVLRALFRGILTVIVGSWTPRNRQAWARFRRWSVPPSATSQSSRRQFERRSNQPGEPGLIVLDDAIDDPKRPMKHGHRASDAGITPRQKQKQTATSENRNFR